MPSSDASNDSVFTSNRLKEEGVSLKSSQSEQATEAPTQPIIQIPPVAERTLKPIPAISFESAAEQSWSVFDHAHEMFELTELSDNRPPPGSENAKIFRGFFWKSGSQDKLKHIEMRFERDKWVVSTGDSLNEMETWAPRDVVPFRDRPDEWTMYLDKNEGLFLKHFPKVNISELNGDYEVLSGLIMTKSPSTATHVALIGLPDAWPSEAVTIRLFPTRPSR